MKLNYYYLDKKPDCEILCYFIQNALLRSDDEGFRGGGCERMIYRRMVVELFLNWRQEPREIIAGKANREIYFGNSGNPLTLGAVPRRIFYRPVS